MAQQMNEEKAPHSSLLDFANVAIWWNFSLRVVNTVLPTERWLDNNEKWWLSWFVFVGGTALTKKVVISTLERMIPY